MKKDGKLLKVVMMMLRKSVWILFGVVLILLLIGGLQIVTPTWMIAIAVAGFLLVIALFAWWEQNLLVLGFITWYFLTATLTSYTFNYTFMNTCKVATDCFTYTIAGPTWTSELFGWFYPFLGESNFLIITTVATVGLVFLWGFLLWKRSQQKIGHRVIATATRRKEWLLFGSFIASLVLMYPIIIINYLLPGAGGQSDAYVSWITVGLFGVLNFCQFGLFFWLLSVSWQARDWRFLTLVLTWVGVMLVLLTTTAALVVNPNNPLMNFGATVFSFSQLIAGAPISGISMALGKAEIIASNSGATLALIPYSVFFLITFLTREKIRNYFINK